MVLFLAVAMVAGGCGWFGGSGADEVADEFVAAFASGDTARAAALTDSPRAAKNVLGQARRALEPKGIDAAVREVRESPGSEEVTATYTLTWRLGKGRSWEYQANARLHTVDGEWRVRWRPSVVHPKLGVEQTLALHTEEAMPAPVLDRHGAELLQSHKVVSVLVDPAVVTANRDRLDQVTGTLADALGPLDASITKRSITNGLRDTKKGDPYLAASLRWSDYLSVKPRIYELPGVRFTTQERLLPAERDFGGRILTAIRAFVQDDLSGRAGWRVVTVDATGGEIARLGGAQPKPAEAVESTLSLYVQQAAERALDGTGFPAALVAMRPSTGELVAVAQNAKADKQGAIALTGRYPPGSTFKIATAVAALSSGRTGVNTRVACPPTTVLGGRLVPNDERFGLGTVPLHTAFAHSCNTTFARLATELPPSSLTDAAASLGIGADFVIPGITTITGSVPPADTVVQRAENGFGQGKVLASPFGMALATATVASGKIPVPTLIRGYETKATKLGKAPTPEVLADVRRMMREVVTSGTATALRDLPGVHGKTGTAQYGDGTKSHGWFAGYQDDLAFAVLLAGAGSSAPAVDVTGNFLGNLGR